MGFLTKLFSGNKENEIIISEIDVSSQAGQIRKKEELQEIPPGRKIHHFNYNGLEIRIDRDITLNYRICIFEGEEKLFTFSIYAKKGEYDILKNALEQVSDFLCTDRSIKKLPNNEVLKGFLNYH